MNPDNFKNLKQILSLTDFGSVLATECPNGAYNKFLDIYDNAFNLAIPTKIIKLNRRYIKREPWVTQGLLNSSITKLELLRANIRKPSEHNKHKYKEFCKVFNCIKRSAKSNYYTDIFAINVNNIKRTWELLRQALNKQTKRSPLNDTFLIGNNETNRKEEIANGFNTFFTNIGTNISDQIIQPPNLFSDYLNDNHPINFVMIATDPDELVGVTSSLKTNTSQGFDNLSTRIIKQTMGEVATPLSHIFNQSFLTGLVPEKLKIARIVPIFKSGEKKSLVIIDQ